MELKDLIKQVETDTHVSIILKEGEGDARGPADPDDVADILPVIREVLLEYPEALRVSLLSTIAIYGKFQMAGKPFLGSAIPKEKRINLAIRSRTSIRSMRSTLHHEIAHLIEVHPKFPKAEWLALSAPFEGLLEDAEHHPRDWYLERGFVSRYASKNRHEDFAEFAELALTQAKELRSLANEYPAIAAKKALFSDIYAAIGMPI